MLGISCAAEKLVTSQKWLSIMELFIVFGGYCD
jgi:hypothetical protein